MLTKQIKDILKYCLLLLRFAWEEDKFHLSGYFIVTIFSAILSILANFAYKYMIDAVFIGIQTSKASSFFLVIMTYFVTYNISQFFYNISFYYFDYITRSKFQNILTRKFMEKIASLDFAHLENGEIRNLIAKTKDAYSWRLPEIIQRICYLAYNSVSLILATIIAYQFSPFYTILLIAITIPFYILRAKVGNAEYSIYSLNAFKTNFLWMLQGMFTSLSTISEIKLYGLSGYFVGKTKKIQDELMEEYRKPILRYSIISTFEYIATPIVMYLAVSSIITQIITHQRSIGDFTLFVGMLFTFGGDVANILSNLYKIYENSLYAKDYFNLISMKNTIKNIPNAKLLSSPKEIKLDHVSFAYPQTKKEVLHDINFTFKTSEDIAIVGHNGAGKTTLIKLLLRFYDPTKGRILVDGIDLKEIDIDSWYRSIGVLFQDFARYDLPLKENISVGDINKNSSDLTLNESLKAANAMDLPVQLTKGLDQRLGRWLEDSEELSVGQWQKVAIARALYRSAPILILDEPTSNIDAESEYNIFENLKKVYKDKSLIFISHRFSTVRMADKIFVLDHGKLVEQGSHEELLKNKKLYSKYFNLQKKGYE
ncbi:MAG TPA: ABC transporter ATP-binding protein [Patescibacteria group bacterium]